MLIKKKCLKKLLKFIMNYLPYSKFWDKYNIDPKFFGLRVKELSQSLKNKLGKNYKFYFSELINTVKEFEEDLNHYSTFTNNLVNPENISEELSILTKPYDSYSELWKKYNIEPKLLGTRVKEN